MDAKTILEKVKVFFNELAAAPAAPPAGDPPANEYELKIGGMITIDKMEVGGIVMIDGAPAVAGDIELKDGTMLTVGDNGIITSVTPGMEMAAPPAPPAPAPPAFDAQSKFTEFEAAQAQKFTALEAKFAEYQTRFDAIDDKVKKTMTVMEEMLKLSQILVDAPAAGDPGLRKPAGFKEDKPEFNTNILFS